MFVKMDEDCRERAQLSFMVPCRAILAPCRQILVAARGKEPGLGAMISLGRSHLSFLACNGAAAWWLIVEVSPALEASRMPSMAIVDVI
jgi:hypothetical protein